MCRPRTRGPVTELSPGTYLRTQLRDVTNRTGGCGHRALSKRLSPTCVIQCHSQKLLLPVIHNSRPYLVSRIFEILRCKLSHGTRHKILHQRKLIAVKFSLLCSSKTKSKLLHSILTIVSLQWSLCLFVSISCLQTLHSLNSLLCFHKFPHATYLYLFT